jgi:hypothetical protein
MNIREKLGIALVMICFVLGCRARNETEDANYSNVNFEAAGVESMRIFSLGEEGRKLCLNVCLSDTEGVSCSLIGSAAISVFNTYDFLDEDSKDEWKVFVNSFKSAESRNIYYFKDNEGIYMTARSLLNIGDSSGCNMPSGLDPANAEPQVINEVTEGDIAPSALGFQESNAPSVLYNCYIHAGSNDARGGRYYFKHLWIVMGYTSSSGRYGETLPLFYKIENEYTKPHRLVYQQYEKTPSGRERLLGEYILQGHQIWHWHESTGLSHGAHKIPNKGQKLECSRHGEGVLLRLQPKGKTVFEFLED